MTVVLGPLGWGSDLEVPHLRTLSSITIMEPADDYMTPARYTSACLCGRTHMLPIGYFRHPIEPKWQPNA